LKLFLFNFKKTFKIKVCNCCLYWPSNWH